MKLSGDAGGVIELIEGAKLTAVAELFKDQGHTVSPPSDEITVVAGTVDAADDHLTAGIYTRDTVGHFAKSAPTPGAAMVNGVLTITSGETAKSDSCGSWSWSENILTLKDGFSGPQIKFAAGYAGPAVIKLEGDVTIAAASEPSISDTEDLAGLIIEPNGHTLTADSDRKGTIQVSGTLTIKGSSTVKAGVIRAGTGLTISGAVTVDAACDSTDNVSAAIESHIGTVSIRDSAHVTGRAGRR